MMEIKFRAYWNNPYHNKNIPVNSGYMYYNLSNAEHMERWSNNMCDSEEPELFTGSKDKDGVDVYEGDIVNSEWHTFIFYIKYYKHNGFSPNHKSGYIPTEFSTEDHKVIGNKRENPELLKEKE